MISRTNAEWLTALKGAGEAQASALSELRVWLLRAARYTLARSRDAVEQLAPGDIEQLAEDSTQEALSALLRRLDRFRGESRFTTWAYKFAVNAALVAARRERWRRLSLDRVLDSPDAADRLRWGDDGASDPHRRAVRREILAAIRDGIERQLTQRQRRALTALLFDEVPLDELARHWGSNRNALYKLLHDARRKLKAHLRERGFEAADMLDAFSGGA